MVVVMYDGERKHPCPLLVCGGVSLIAAMIKTYCVRRELLFVLL